MTFMFELSDSALITFLTDFAFEPWKAYGLIVFFMLACAVILPFPEELLLLGAGLVAHAARNPELAAARPPGGAAVDTLTMCIVCFVAVFISDLLVYYLGRFFGARIIRTRFFQLRFAGERFDRINAQFSQYGGWAAALFRFTPGLRFPGHLACGFLGMSFWKFAAIDALATLIFVPPQIYLIAVYGDVFLKLLTQIKDGFFYIILALIVGWVLKRYLKSRRVNTL